MPKRGQPPEELFCPITYELMTDAVKTSDGHIYSRRGIEQWLQNHNTSPLTNLALANKTLTPAQDVCERAKYFILCEHTVFLETVTKKNLQALQDLNYSDEHLNACDELGNTCLHLAFSHSHSFYLNPINAELVNYLIAEGAPLNIRNKSGHTPLHLASSYGDTRLIELLISKGADVTIKDNKGRTPLHKLAYSLARKPQDKKQIIQKFLEKGLSIHDVDHKGRTLLHRTIKHSPTRVTIDLLLSFGSKINHKDNKGRTPSYLAMRKGTPNVIRILEEKKSEIKLLDENGRKDSHKVTLSSYEAWVALDELSWSPIRYNNFFSPQKKKPETKGDDATCNDEINNLILSPRFAL